MENYYSEHEGKTIDKVIREASLHMQDNVKHVTQAERDVWNGKASPESLQQLQNSLQQGINSNRELIDGLQNSLEQKMDAGQLASLTELTMFQVQALLAYTIGWETKIKVANGSSRIENYIIPMGFLDFDQFRLELVEGTMLYPDSDFLYGTGSTLSIFQKGEFKKWYDMPTGNLNMLKIAAYSEGEITVKMYLRHKHSMDDEYSENEVAQ